MSESVELSLGAFKSVVESVVKSICNSKLEQQLQRACQTAINKSEEAYADVQKTITDFLKSPGVEKQLRNLVYQHLVKQLTPTQSLCVSASNSQSNTELSFISRAQANWEKRVVKSLNSMCTELNVSLAKQRADKDIKEYKSHWTELGTIPRDLGKFRPVYAPKDFLEVVAGLRNPNFVDSSVTACSSTSFWGMVEVPLRVYSLTELREVYAENSISLSQCGIDDSPDVASELFENDRTKLAKKVVAAGLAPVSAQFAKRGCPVSYRAAIWCQILSIDLDATHIAYYEHLKAGVIQHDLLVDSLVYKDVKLTAANDDQYFVFEDYLYQILLPFSRDTYVLERLHETCATAPKSYIGGKHGVEDYAIYYPPCGIIPFHGFCMLVAPLCYVYNDPVQLYFVFREIYVRYFLRLHILSSHKNGIVNVCRLFESLLQHQQPQLAQHLRMIGLQPLRIAFKWFVRAYSGYLASEEVLLLWDRIIAYNSLDILAVLAVAIFSFRKTNLMQVFTANAAEGVLADLTTLSVMPLIQLALFAE